VTRTFAVVNAAIELDDERQLLIRRTLGAMSLTTDVDMLIARPPSGSAWDVGLPGTFFPASAPQPVRREALRTVVSAVSGPPPPHCACADPSPVAVTAAVETEWLRAVGGDSPALYAALGQLDAGSRAVFFGSATPTTDIGIGWVPAEVEVVVVPLVCDRAPASGPLARAALERADTVLVTSSREAKMVDAPAGRVVEIGVGLHVGLDPTAGVPHGIPQRDYVLVLGDFDERTSGPILRRDARRLARSLAGAEVVALTHGFVHLDEWPAELTVREAGSRADLWRWMAHAVAVVDLRKDRLIARDVIEAMACGIPVIVPATSVARDHIEHGGGIWYRNHTDIQVAVEALLDDPDLRARLGREGRSAAARWCDIDGFTATVGRVLGPEPVAG
jgi:hypothetical protein